MTTSPREHGRESDEHVVRVKPIAEQIVAATRKQLSHGRYPPSSLYGSGRVSIMIAEALANLSPYTQKQLHYIYDGTDSKPDRSGGRDRDGAIKKSTPCVSQQS